MCGCQALFALFPLLPFSGLVFGKIDLCLMCFFAMIYDLYDVFRSTPLYFAKINSHFLPLSPIFTLPLMHLYLHLLDSVTTLDKLDSHCSTPRVYAMFKHSSRACVRSFLASAYFPSKRTLSPKARKHWAAPS